MYNEIKIKRGCYPPEMFVTT